MSARFFANQRNCERSQNAATVAAVQRWNFFLTVRDIVVLNYIKTPASSFPTSFPPPLLTY